MGRVVVRRRHQRIIRSIRIDTPAAPVSATIAITIGVRAAVLNAAGLVAGASAMAGGGASPPAAPVSSTIAITIGVRAAVLNAAGLVAGASAMAAGDASTPAAPLESGATPEPPRLFTATPFGRARYGNLLPNLLPLALTLSP